MMPFFSRKGPSGYSSYTTAEEVTRGLDGAGLVAIVTGATNGIGVETARVLALRGVRVVMGIRNQSAGAKVRDAIAKEVPGAEVDMRELDLSSMASVRKFASDFQSMKLPLNILINNAGIGAVPFSLSKDGIEQHFATNYLGHFLLTHLLLENMVDSSSKSGIEGRIVNVSSELHLYPYKEGIRFDKINDKSGYNPFLAYGQSKLANVLHAAELSRRLQQRGAKVTANSLHPGTIATNIASHNMLYNAFFTLFGKVMGKSVQQGAATTCYVALHPHAKGVSGKFFSDCNMVTPGKQARDEEMARKLWDFSMDLIKN